MTARHAVEQPRSALDVGRRKPQALARSPATGLTSQEPIASAEKHAVQEPECQLLTPIRAVHADTQLLGPQYLPDAQLGREALGFFGTGGVKHPLLFGCAAERSCEHANTASIDVLPPHPVKVGHAPPGFITSPFIRDTPPVSFP